MHTRFRWYRIQLPRGATDLGELVEKSPFLAESLYGFSRISASLGGSSHRFFWRTKVVITRLDKDDSPIYEQVASVSFTDFAVVVVEKVIFLRIENPGKNIRDLLNALESIVGMGFTAKQITFDRAKPTSVFEQVDIAKLVGLKVVGAVVGADLVARMEFSSKEGMIVENMAVLNGLQYKVDLAIFELLYKSIRGQVSFAANGAVKISGALAPKLVNFIEQDLPRLM